MTEIGGTEFKDLDAVEIVGLYPNYAEAQRAWQICRRLNRIISPKKGRMLGPKMLHSKRKMPSRSITAELAIKRAFAACVLSQKYE